MQFLFQYPRRLFRWVVRFRHRCGYGIHSPFAFSFVCSVIYERGMYYAYSRLDQTYSWTSSRGFRRKDCRLLFRLANYVHPAVCSLDGASARGTWFEHLSAGSRTTLYEESLCSAGLVIGSTGWASHVPQLIGSVLPGGVLLVPDVDRGQANREAWAALLESPQAQVTFNLGDFGIVFYRPDLQREHYIINYF